MNDKVENEFIPRKFVGLTCGTFTAWLSLVLLQFLSMTITGASTEFFFKVLLPLNLIFGLPIAIIVCFTFGSITWYICEALHLTKLRHAILGGAIIGIALTGIFYLLNEGIAHIYLGIPVILGVLASCVTHVVGYAKPPVHSWELES